MFLNKLCRILTGSALLLAIGLYGSANAGPAEPSVSATDQDSLRTDLNSDGKVNRGDTIRHTITIRNTGDTDASGLDFSEILDSGTTLVGPYRTTPVALDDNYSVNEDETLTTAAPGVLGNDIDPDGDAKTAIKVTDPSGGALSLNPDGSFTYTPDSNFNGSDSFTYKVNDSTSDSENATVTLTVINVEDPPVAVNDAVTVTEDSGANTINVQANDTDIDGGTNTITSVTQPVNGTVVITNGGADLTYAPNANYCNDGSPLDTFTYTLNPGGSTATVSVTVTCVNDPPVAVADAATLIEDSGANTINVQANDTDVDGGTNTITLVTQPVNGTVIITNGGADLTYAPNANYCNTPPGTTLETFTYTLSPDGSTATVSVTVTCVDDPPVAVADAATVIEDSGANTINVRANDTDIDGGTKTVQSVIQPANGTVVITNGGADLTYAPDANYCNNGSTLDTFTYTLLPDGSTATVSVTVTCVDDPPVAVADAATVIEDSGANTINVRANDTDIDGGTKTVQSVIQPANGTVVITNGGADLTYAPDANYCNNGPTLDTFTYTLLPGGSTTTVSVTVTCVNDPPVADADTFDFIGNTELRIDLAAASTPHALDTTGSGFGVLDNDDDPVENDPVFVSGIVGCADVTAPFDCTIPGVGTVVMESDGKFSFMPEPGDADESESFQYILSDGTDTVNGTVTLNRFERVWYVDNSAEPEGNGTSTAPFDILATAQEESLANDYIFVYFGDETSTGQNAGISLKNGQRLLGEHVGLSIPVNLNGNGTPTVLVAAAPGNRPVLGDEVAGGPEGVSAIDVIPSEVAGLSLSGNVNAIEWTTNGQPAAFAGSGTFTIRDNVVTGAGAIGVDINLAGTGATGMAFHNNNLTATATALNVQETGFGALTITHFNNNVVSGNTGGSGIIVNNAIFDSVPGGGVNTVDGGTTVIGASGNGVGGAGMTITNVQGDLHFTGNLSIFADGGSGLTVSGTGAGMQLRVNSGGAPTGIVEATVGPAVNASAVGLDLRLTSLKSTNSTSTGVSLTNVTGTFSAESGSSITNATGTDFLISGGTANITYKGTITDDIGQLVSVSGATAGTRSFGGAITDGDDGDGSGISLSGNTGSAINFSGGVTLSTGANTAFSATGGGTVTVTGSTNKLTTTTATALNIANTTIGSSGLTFRSISSNGGGNSGIVLDSTGALGGLTVTGTGSAGTGGTIQNKTVNGISLTNTRNVSLSYMNITSNDGSGIYGDDVTNFSLISSSVTNNADTGNGSEAGLRFNELLGACAITNSTISGSHEDNIRMTPASGTLTNLNISGSTIGPNRADSGNNGLTMLASGTADVTINVTNSSFTGNLATSLYVNVSSDSKGSVNVSSSAFQNSGSAVHLATNNNADLNFNVTNNTEIVSHKSNAIQFVAASTGTSASLIRGTISGNPIGNGSLGSGSDLMYGIALDLRGSQDAVIKVDNNNIRHTNLNGIWVTAAGPCGATGGRLDLTLTNNSVGQPDNDSFPASWVYGVLVEAAQASTVCLDMSGNTSASVGGAEQFRVRQRDTSAFKMERLTSGLITNPVTVETFVVGQNAAGSTADATLAAGFGFTGVADGSCRLPQ